MLRLTLLTSALLCSGLAVLFAMWIVVPAPAYKLFQVAVGASEWSLWFGALGLAGASFGLLALASGARWPAWVAVSLGVASVALAMYPPLDAWRVARENKIELSLREYLAGSNESALAPVERTTETFATVEGQTLKLDVYLSRVKGETLQLPAVIVVHGGSWSAGERSDYPLWNEWLARQGYAVFDIDYRIAPQPNWQTATGDVKCAVSWVKANAARYGVDTARVALLGRSAGGHLALLAAYSTGKAALPSSCDSATAPDSSVRAVVSFYAPTDLRWGYEHPANERVLDGPGKIRALIGGTPGTAAETLALASVTSHVDERTPPTLLFHGGHDQLVRDENMSLLAERLRQQRVAHRAVFIPYAQHAFDYNYNGWGSQIARRLISQFLRTHLESQR
jgi:acetyl esterase/lipase